MTTPPKRATGTYLHALDLLRVFASIFVIYAHASHWFAYQEHHMWWAKLVDDYVIGTLQLNPYLSFLGVGTFLVVSGLVVTRVAHRETPGQFLSRRLTRIAPVLFLVTFLGWILINIGVYTSESRQESMGLLELVSAATLVGFFTTPEVIVLGVAWTLLAQVFFLAYVAATIPLLHRHAWIPHALAAAIVFITLTVTTDVHTVPVIRFGVIAAMFPVMCIGALIALVQAGKVRPGVGIGIGATHFLLFVWADKLGRQHLQTGTEHPRTLALIILVVLVATYTSGRISRSKAIQGWARRTYVIYLVHPLCLYPVLTAMTPIVGPQLALLAALLVIAAVTEILHRWFEMPIERWLRARQKRRPLPAAVA